MYSLYSLYSLLIYWLRCFLQLFTKTIFLPRNEGMPFKNPVSTGKIDHIDLAINFAPEKEHLGIEYI